MTAANIHMTEFDPENEEMTWHMWVDVLRYKLDAAGVKAEFRVPSLMSNVGIKTAALIKQIVSPDQPYGKTFAELVALVHNFLYVRNNNMSLLESRFQAFQAKQQNGESISEFASRLQKLTESLQFDEEYLSIALICGIQSETIRRRIFLEKYPLTFAEYVSIAQEWESVLTNQENVLKKKRKIIVTKTNYTTQTKHHNTMKVVEDSLNNTSINVNQVDYAKGGENKRIVNAPDEAANIPDIMNEKINNKVINDENNSNVQFEVLSCIADNEDGKLAMQTCSTDSIENNLHLSDAVITGEEINISNLNKFRRILQNINAASFDQLSNVFLDVDIYTDDITNGIIDLIFHAMISKPSNIRLYAKLCTRLFLEIPFIETSLTGDAGYMTRSSFRTRFMKRCEHEFQTRSSKSEACKKHIESNLLDQECCQIARHRILGIIELIGELYNFGNFSTNSVICNCLTNLLSQKSGTDAANTANDVIYARHLIRICGRKFALDGGKQFLFTIPTAQGNSGHYNNSQASGYNKALPTEICDELWTMMKPDGSDWSQA